MALPNLPFNILATSKQLISGLHINNLTYLLTGTATSITAKAGGGYAGAPTLGSWSNELTTVATAADSVALPLAKSGLRVIVINNGAQAAAVFPQPTDTINGGAAGAAAPGGLANAGATAMFICIKDGQWRRFVSA